jgi:hypothetical protein
MRDGQGTAHLAAWLCLLTASCGRDRVEIIAGPDCPPSLGARLKVTSIELGRNIAWQKAGYDQFPVDERVALAAKPGGRGAYVAWGEVNLDAEGGVSLPSPLGVHVTSLDASLAPMGTEVVLSTAEEVSGLVAHDDGFAILVKDADPGDAIDTGDGATVAFLVRYREGRQDWSFPLSGSQSEATENKTVYSPFLEGQLAWSDSVYAAQFVVEGGATDPEPRFWRDVLVFRDSFGLQAPLPIAHGCQNNGGIRLIPDSGKTNLVANTIASIPQVTGLCVQQSRQALKLTSLEADRVVSSQEVQWAGYSGAKLGSLLKVPDGYLVFWLSLGSTNEHQGHDIRMAKLDRGFDLVSGPVWFSRTPGIEEWNLHVVPYGTNRLLLVYSEIQITGTASESTWAMYLGNYLGTRLMLLDSDGRPVSDSSGVLVPNAPTTANAEPVVLEPSGDVAWAFVNPSPDYTRTVFGPNGPGQTAIHVARICYRP